MGTHLYFYRTCVAVEDLATKQGTVSRSDISRIMREYGYSRVMSDAPDKLADQIGLIRMDADTWSPKPVVKETRWSECGGYVVAGCRKNVVTKILKALGDPPLTMKATVIALHYLQRYKKDTLDGDLRIFLEDVGTALHLDVGPIAYPTKLESQYKYTCSVLNRTGLHSLNGILVWTFRVSYRGEHLGDFEAPSAQEAIVMSGLKAEDTKVTH